MSRSQLRIYSGPDSRFAPAEQRSVEENKVTVALGEILPMLADAVRSRRTWLEDFEADEVTITTDLYEVILAYQHCRRPSA